MRIMLMGPPASGKGTVGALLSEKLEIPIFSVGKLLRNIPSTDPLYEQIHESMDLGKLVPNEIPAELIRKELEDKKYIKGFILDGWMRDMNQKDSFDPQPDRVIFINISEKTTLKRISGRRVCQKDGFNCNIYTLPPKSENHCNKCGGELIQRDDDKEEVVENRLSLYENDTKPVIDYYRELGSLVEIDGEGTPEEVLDLILVALPKNDSN